jgi:hypothetical protein
MRTYTRLDGTVHDITDLTLEEARFFDDAVRAFRANTPWAEFNNTWVSGPRNPLIRDAGGVLTRAVWENDLFQCLYDLGDRLGVAQGMVTHDGEVRDPLQDEQISVPEAAKLKGVSVPGLHKAIERRAIVGRSMHQGGRVVVSKNSLSRWSPDPVRQAARRTGAARRGPAAPVEQPVLSG